MRLVGLGNGCLGIGCYGYWLFGDRLRSDKGCSGYRRESGRVCRRVQILVLATLLHIGKNRVGSAEGGWRSGYQRLLGQRWAFEELEAVSGKERLGRNV